MRFRARAQRRHRAGKPGRRKAAEFRVRLSDFLAPFQGAMILFPVTGGLRCAGTSGYYLRPLRGL